MFDIIGRSEIDWEYDDLIDEDNERTIVEEKWEKYGLNADEFDLENDSSDEEDESSDEED